MISTKGRYAIRVMLDLAENGDDVQFRNLYAALLLKRGDALQAVRQLRIADRIAPGHPPTLFNRALCAMLSGLPDQALAWIVRYRARFPRDEQAMRLQFNLLLQADRPEGNAVLGRRLLDDRHVFRVERALAGIIQNIPVFFDMRMFRTILKPWLIRIFTKGQIP